MMLNNLVYILLLGLLQINAQEPFRIGELIDSLSVMNMPQETFTLYLPKSYNSDGVSSIVFIYDPAARGKVGIGPFIEASEIYGHILVCSNNSKNGPYDLNFLIADRLFKHVFSNFNIDAAQIYLAGFSGGSRLASALATMTDQMAGVVACGAGFSPAALYTPTIQKFSYVSICGNRDMNYSEMIETRDYLNRLNFNNTMITYDGNHGWPPSFEILKAFDWLAIQAHKKGVRVQTADKIYNSYQRNYKNALDFEDSGQLIKAFEGYERIANNYVSFYTLDSIYSRLKNLTESKAFKILRKSLAMAFEKEKILSGKFYKRFDIDYQKPQSADLDWWSRELGKLDRLNLEEPETQKMVDRLRSKLYVMAISKTNPDLNNTNDEQTRFCKSICKLIYPEFQQ